jgi:four helix bundle protein
MAKKIDDLPVFQKALEFWSAVNTILDRPSLRRNRDLWNQISNANDSITSNMREGFEQTSDDSFANFLVYAKGSVAEVVTRLQAATGKRLLSEQEFKERVLAGESLARCWGASSSI